MLLLILFALFSIIFSFLCSLWEACLLSIPPSYVQVQKGSESRISKQLMSMKNDIDRPLAAILTLNTIAHTVGAIGVGAQAAKIWPHHNWALNIGFTEFSISITGVLVPIAMTLAILILSEIIPKTIGATYWKSLVTFTISSVAIITIILYPLVLIARGITYLIKSSETQSVFSRSEFRAMAEMSAEEGIIRKDEEKIITNLMKFNTIRVKDIMTPRTVVETANADTTIRKFYDEHTDMPFSRIPVYEERMDHITGYVLKDDILEAILEKNGDQPLKSIQLPITMIDEKTKITNLFNQMLENREQIAMVVDEYGGLVGIVTGEDIIETLLGLEIIDEKDNISDMQIMARERWKARAKKMGLHLTDEEKEETSTDPEDSRPS